MLGVPSLQIRKATERPQVYDCGSSVKFDPGAARATTRPRRVFASSRALHGKSFDHGLGDGHASERLVDDLVAAARRRTRSAATCPRTPTSTSRAPTARTACRRLEPAPAAAAAVWPSLAIVVPVYNEAATIERAMRGDRRGGGRIPRRRRLVIAVDDGSADESAAVLRAARRASSSGFESCSARAQRGATARRCAPGPRERAELGFEYVAFIDSRPHQPARGLLRDRRARQPRATPTSRRRASSPAAAWRACRASRRLSRAPATSSGRLLFGAGVRDVTNGFRAVRTEPVACVAAARARLRRDRRGARLGAARGVEPVEFPTVLRPAIGRAAPDRVRLQSARSCSYLRYPAAQLLRRLRVPAGEDARRERDLPRLRRAEPSTRSSTSASCRWPAAF